MTKRQTVRHGSRRIYFYTGKDATPDEIEKRWHHELIRYGALGALMPERIHLMELLEPLPAEQAREIYEAAIEFMSVGLDTAVAMAEALREIEATPAGDSGEAVKSKLLEVLNHADNLSVLPLDVQAVVDSATIKRHKRRHKELEDRFCPDVATPQEATPQAVLTESERARLSFYLWRLKGQGPEAAP